MLSPSFGAGLLAIATTLPLAPVLACYNGGLPFSEILGGVGENEDAITQISEDITTVCEAVEGLKVKKDEPWKYCDTWTVTVVPDDSCFDSCLGVCVPDCGSYCNPDCGGPVEGSKNRIDWEIQYEGDGDEGTMTQEICEEALQGVLNECDNGSKGKIGETWWWKIDPNSGACSDSAPTTLPVPPQPPSPPDPEPSAAPPETTSSAVPSSTSVTALADPSPYPDSPVTNEFQYRGYKEDSDSDKATRKKIHDAFGAWGGVLDAAFKSLNDKDDKTYDRWFPEKAGDNDGREYVKGVFGQLFDSSTAGPKAVIADLINEATDVTGTCAKNAATKAYMLPFSGRFHICAPGLSQSTLPTDNKCKDLGNAVSTKMNMLTGTLLHEFMHYKITDKAPNSLGHIKDEVKSNPKLSFDLRKGDKSQTTFTNAASYQWFAINAHYKSVCNQEIGDPVVAAEVEAEYEEGEEVSESE